MKKFFGAIIGLTAMTAATYAATPRLDNSIPQMNAVMADLLRPFENNLTRASLRFLALSTNDTLLLSTRLDGSYSRSGSVQTLGFQLRNLSFDYRMGTPIMNMGAQASFDFTRAFSQDQINAAVDSGEGLAESYVRDRMKEYGDALRVKATMLERIKDTNGNYTSFRGLVTFSIDMTKLPAGLKKEDVLSLNGSISLNVELKSSVKMESTMNLNPAYQNYPMLKQDLEKLLTRDVDMSKMVSGKFEKLNDFAGKLVETRP